MNVLHMERDAEDHFSQRQRVFLAVGKRPPHTVDDTCVPGSQNAAGPQFGGVKNVLVHQLHLAKLYVIKIMNFKDPKCGFGSVQKYSRSAKLNVFWA
jgi:hypothetical protein